MRVGDYVEVVGGGEGGGSTRGEGREAGGEGWGGGGVCRGNRVRAARGVALKV